MKKFCITYVAALLICLQVQGISASSRTNFKVTRLQSCSKDNSTRFYANIITDNGNQYLDFDITIHRALDESIGSTCDLQSTLDDKTYLSMFVIREKDLCKGNNIYLGEFWYDIVRAAQFTPGTCPIPARRYYVHHHLLQYNKIKLQTFPFGKIRAVFNAIDNRSKNKESLFCLMADVENLGN